MKKKKSFRRSVRYYFIKLFRIKDSSDKIARGFAWGAFVAVWPSYPFNTLLAFLIAPLLKGNRMAAIIGSWLIGPPFLTPVFYYASYITGKYLFKLFSIKVEYLSIAQIQHFVNNPIVKTLYYLHPENYIKLWHKIDGFFWALEFGGLILGIISALTAYYCIGYIKIIWFNKIRKRRK